MKIITLTDAEEAFLLDHSHYAQQSGWEPIGTIVEKVEDDAGLLNVSASDINVHARIANVGKVTAKNAVGAFYVFEVESTEWSLATGTIHTTRRDVVCHSADMVLLESNYVC